jgi:prepilin-type N-terminal cleavage/methylation domain-containing protein/prepilin-type processing-associated H-X9-DG protein
MEKTMPRPTRRAFTLVELLVVVTIISVLAALLLPALQSAREASRRVQCQNHLRQIGLALHNYTAQHGRLPPGAILANYPGTGTTSYDPLVEATSTAKGNHGTSWLLQVLPFIEQQTLYDRWDFSHSVASNQAVAATNIEVFFCPTRRQSTRQKDRLVMFPRWDGASASAGWTAGGNDYAGCLGAQNAYDNPTTSNRARKFCGPNYVYDSPATGTTPAGAGICLRGIFVPNFSTSVDEITDGLTATLMIGEVPRRQWAGSAPDTYWAPCHTHVDGWAVAGPSTLFDTAKVHEGTDQGQPGGFNSDYFEAAGSEHQGGAYFGMADGSVQFLSDHIDSIAYANLGSMADGQPTGLLDR